MSLPRVLMVTGAYPPELSGAGLQCGALARALRGRAEVTVLTTCTDARLPAVDRVEGVDVYRIVVDLTRRRSLVRAAWHLTVRFAQLANRIDLVHLHGFSRKSCLVTMLTKLFGKPFVIKLTLVDEDDPVRVRARGRLAAWCYAQADGFIGVSPKLAELYDAAGLPKERFRLIPNGVDTNRFRPAGPDERRALKAQLGLPPSLPAIVFVGIFARRKRPDLALHAWRQLVEGSTPPASLVFVGGADTSCHETDPVLVQMIRDEIAGLDDAAQRSVILAPTTVEIERYYRAADLFVLTSRAEGMPNALLEAMACGVPCVASRLPGITDAAIEDCVNGRLMDADDAGRLAELLRELLQDPAAAQAMGRRASATIAQRFSIDETAARHLELYTQLTDRASALRKN